MNVAVKDPRQALEVSPGDKNRGWIFPLPRLLQSLRAFRAGPLDNFSRLPERELRDACRGHIATLTSSVSNEPLGEAVEIADAPAQVQNYGHVRTLAALAMLKRLRNLNRNTMAGS